MTEKKTIVLFISAYVAKILAFNPNTYSLNKYKKESVNNILLYLLFYYMCMNRQENEFKN